MKTIYNEGRVVGLSSYELYVRQLLSTNPEATPMSEREWLSNSLSESTSMILRVPAGTGVGPHDYSLPSGSQLCGASVIYGSLFQGEVELSDDGHWATKVTDYGELISNTPESHPVTPGTSEYVPTKPNPTDLPEQTRRRCDNYIRIQSAMMIQPGEWLDDEEAAACKILDPDFSKLGFVRILVAEPIEEDVLILLHGFANTVLIKGSSMYAAPGQSRRPQDGDFLGPTVFPWSCPIYLTVSNDAYMALVRDYKDTIRELKEHVAFLGTLHTLRFVAPLEDQQGNRLLTESNEELVADEYGTVSDMWRMEGYPDPDFPFEPCHNEEPE